MENNNNKKPLMLGEQGSFSIDVINDKEKAMALFTDIAKNKNIGVNTPEEALVLYLKAKELNIGFANALDHMHVINRKTGIDIHILKAILSRAGRYIKWTKTKDYLPQYQYTDGTSLWTSVLKPKAFIKWLADEDPFYDKARYVTNKDQGTAAKTANVPAIMPTNAEGKLVPIDYVTEYLFEREVQFGKEGRTEMRTELSMFTRSMGLRHEKNNTPGGIWQTNPEVMVDHRAFTFGARAIASDLIMGCYETKELNDMYGIDYRIDADGNVIEDNTQPQFKEKSPVVDEQEIIDVTDVTSTDKEA